MPEITHSSKLQAIDNDIVFADDDRKTMIKVDHVSMDFNMASEKLNSLKEYAIALIKHNLFFEKFTALDDVSFEVKKGDVFGILGTNGSGKSTLLKIIAGVLEPTSGKCELNGNIAPLIELGAGFDMELSARENIYLNGSLLGYSKDFIQQHFDDIVEFAEIEKFLDMPMKNYSSGMIARIAFAIATVIVPEILIVDEVLSVGDFMFQQKCENRINDLIHRHGVTVLIVSHINDQVERLCNKAIWIEKGHTRIIGNASQVCDAYRVLGGRTGSSESENYIFNLLLKEEESDYKQRRIPTIGTEDHNDIAARLAWEGWANESELSVILVPDYSHVFSILASGIAGALNAPILPFNKDDITASVTGALSGLNPSKIYVLSYEDAANNIIFNEDIKRICSNIIPIICEQSEEGLVRDTLSFGSKNQLWKTQRALLLPFKDNAVSFGIAPYAYIKKAPSIIYFDSNSPLHPTVIQAIKDAGITELLCPVDIAETELYKSLKNEDIDCCIFSSDLKNDILSIPKWLLENAVFNSERICLSSKTPAHWPALISAPSFAGKTDSLLVLEDTTDLDSMANTLKFLNTISPESISVIGRNGFDQIDKRLISYAANLIG